MRQPRYTNRGLYLRSTSSSWWLGTQNGSGVFFPNGLNGNIKYRTGHNLTDPGT